MSRPTPPVFVKPIAPGQWLVVMGSAPVRTFPTCRECWDHAFDETTYPEWRVRYAETCRAQAVAWGGFHPGGDNVDRLPVVEVLREPGPKKEQYRLSEVEIVHCDGFWSFAPNLRTGTWGTSYGPNVLSGLPSRTRAEILKAASEKILDTVPRFDEPHKPSLVARHRRLIRWAEGLAKPGQTSLF